MVCTTFPIEKVIIASQAVEVHRILAERIARWSTNRRSTIWFAQIVATHVSRKHLPVILNVLRPIHTISIDGKKWNITLKYPVLARLLVVEAKYLHLVSQYLSLRKTCSEALRLVFYGHIIKLSLQTVQRVYATLLGLDLQIGIVEIRSREFNVRDIDDNKTKPLSLTTEIGRILSNQWGVI